MNDDCILYFPRLEGEFGEREGSQGNKCTR